MAGLPLPVATESLVREVDHAAAARRHVYSQFRDSPRIQALVTAFGKGAQLLEDIIWTLIVDRGLDTASGAQLDQWGAIAGEQRGPLIDRDYRRFIVGRIKGNVSNGYTDELITIWALVMDSDDVRHVSNPPAGAYLVAWRRVFYSDEVRRKVARILDDAKPAGVRLLAVEALHGGFGFDDTPDSSGFDEGPWAELIND